MTTLDADQALIVRASTASCRSVYFAACAERGVRFNKRLLELLSSKMGKFEMTDLVLDPRKWYIGAANVSALIAVIALNRALQRIALSAQGVDDPCVAALADVCREHHTVLREIDLSGNEDITDEGGIILLRLVNENRMVSSLRLDGTRVSGAVRRAVARACAANSEVEIDFFKGEYCTLKRVFLRLDTEGRGEIHTMNLERLLHLPQIAAALDRRIESMPSPLGSSPELIRTGNNGALTIFQYLHYAHPSYKSMRELRHIMTLPDTTEDTAVANWAVVAASVAAARIEFFAYHLIVVPHRVLERAEWDALISRAMEAEWRIGGARHQMRHDGSLVLHEVAAVRTVRAEVGAEVDLWRRQRQEPLRMRVPPFIVRELFVGFMEVASRNGSPGTVGSNGSFRAVSLAHLLGSSLTLTPSTEQMLSTMTLPEVTLGDLCRRAVTTRTVSLRLSLLQDHALKWGIGPSITLTFPEWFLFVDEFYDHIATPIYRPNPSEISDADAEQGTSKGLQQPPMPSASFVPETVAQNKARSLLC